MGINQSFLRSLPQRRALRIVLSGAKTAVSGKREPNEVNQLVESASACQTCSFAQNDTSALDRANLFDEVGANHPWQRDRHSRGR